MKQHRWTPYCTFWHFIPARLNRINTSYNWGSFYSFSLLLSPCALGPPPTVYIDDLRRKCLQSRSTTGIHFLRFDNRTKIVPTGRMVSSVLMASQSNIFATVLLISLLSCSCQSASTRSRTTSRCSIDGRGVHKCPRGAPEEKNGLDPRAETFFSARIPVSTSSMKYEFNANYFISDVERTTIFQLLNRDLSSSDRYKPVVFVVAWKKSNGKLKICMFESCSHVWDNINTAFTFRMKASGKKATIWVSGRAKTFDLVRPKNGAYRPRGSHEVRWGVYHHDISKKKAASEARVRVYRISSKGF